MSHEKNLPTFHYTGWLIEILITVYYNPYITGRYNHLYITQPTKVFFIAHMDLTGNSILADEKGADPWRMGSYLVKW